MQFLNAASQSLKVPFGIAQMGKSFRNEITVEHFIFRSCEFEQMEMEYFCPPGEGPSTSTTGRTSVNAGGRARPQEGAAPLPQARRRRAPPTIRTARTTWSTSFPGAGTSSRASPVAPTTTSRPMTPARARSSSTSMPKQPIRRRASRATTTFRMWWNLQPAPPAACWPSCATPTRRTGRRRNRGPHRSAIAPTPRSLSRSPSSRWSRRTKQLVKLGCEDRRALPHGRHSCQVRRAAHHR